MFSSDFGFLQMHVSVTMGGTTVVPVADHPVLMLKSTILFLPTVCIERTYTKRKTKQSCIVEIKM